MKQCITATVQGEAGIASINKTTTCYYRDYNSITEFYNDIKDAPVNSAFSSKKGNLASELVDAHSKSFTKTESFEQAVKKLINGDDEIAKKINEKLNIEFGKSEMKKPIPKYDVVGHQACVPRYLQGLPDSMVNKKLVPAKQKVVTITKNIGYLGYISASEIIDESIEILKIVKKIEDTGVRCNVYICSVAYESYTSIGVRVKVKSSNERLNLSKLSFSMAHPSMLRRLVFRYREVAPETTSGFAIGSSYGSSYKDIDIFNKRQKGEYFVKSMMTKEEREGLLQQFGAKIK